MTMYAQITVTALAPVALADVLGLEASTPEAIFTRLTASAGETVVIRCSGAVWDRLRPQLRKLSQRRIPAVDGAGVVIPGHTRPAMTYTMDWIPGDRPRLHQLEGAVTAATNSTVTVRGENLVPGAAAQLKFVRERVLPSGYSAAGTTPLYLAPEVVLTVTAVAKGPIGNKIGLLIKAPSGLGSVTTQEFADGQVQITVVPAASANDAGSIATQINTDTLAPLWVTAVANVSSALISAFTGSGEISGPNVVSLLPFQFLTGGDGTGIAFADLLVSGTDPTNRLNVIAQRAGNQGNLISLTILVSQGSNSVVVTGSDIVVSRTAATTTLADLRTAIRGNADALALVHPEVVGSGTSSLGAVAKTFLAGGAGEQPVAQIGGASATVYEQSDTLLTLYVAGADLTAAGVAAGEVAQVNILLDYQRLSASVVVA
jgi:hypothetical protein